MPRLAREQSPASCRGRRSGYNYSSCIYKQAGEMSDLTPRQTQILRLIQRFISDTGMPPTRAEIAHELGFRSANAAEERSEEHTSELQSQSNLVCRLLLEKKKPPHAVTPPR